MTGWKLKGNVRGLKLLATYIIFHRYCLEMKDCSLVSKSERGENKSVIAFHTYYIVYNLYII